MWASLAWAGAFWYPPPGGAEDGQSGSSVATSAGDSGGGSAERQAEDPGYLEKTTQRGPVTAVVRIEPSHPRIGDRCTLTLRVTAEDGVELLMPDFGQSLDRFAIREFVPSERVDERGRTVSEQRYTLEPPMSGPLTVPPLLIEFIDRRSGHKPAPDNEDAYELVTEAIAFEVASVTPQAAAADMRPIAGKLPPLAAPRGPLWPWLLGAGLLAAVASPLIWRRIVAARSRARRKSAYDTAIARLEVLAARPRPSEAEAIDAFFVELSAIVRRYLEDRFELRAPELTTEEFLQAAGRTRELSDAQRGFLQDFLRRADMVKFARFIPERNDIEAALSAARRFLEETRERSLTAQAAASERRLVEEGSGA